MSSKIEIAFPKPFRRNKRPLLRKERGRALQARADRAGHGNSCAGARVDLVESFVTAEQVAAELGFGRRTIGRMIAGCEIREVA